uniref:Uncharacterized protein n=1 Tax=Arundo donax TaxID=35708 RepID=A0A0A8ZQC2_ARUDO
MCQDAMDPLELMLFYIITINLQELHYHSIISLLLRTSGLYGAHKGIDRTMNH